MKLHVLIDFLVFIYASNAETVGFSIQNHRFAIFREPATYLEAVAACSTWIFSGDVAGALLPTSLLGDVFAHDEPQTAQELRSALAEAATRQGEQQPWALWTWDEYRVCRAAKLLPAGNGGSGVGPDLALVTTDRPCSWRLAYVCAEEQAMVLAAGLSSSSDWYRRHFAPGARAPLLPSPYAAASAAGPAGASSSSEGSSSQAGLALYRSGFVAGGPLGRVFGANFNVSTLTTEVEDGSNRFWRLGPVVTAMYRGGNRRLTALRLVREGEAADVWAAYQGQSSGAGLPPPLGDEFVLGDRVPDYDLGPGYETYNVGPYNDYIVAVEGCFHANEVEGLTLVSRSGRRLQLGRGGCSNWFREEAPPGGYLAGAWSSFLNASAWDMYTITVGLLAAGSAIQLPFLQQLSFIWAAPSGSPPPVSVVRRAPVLDTWRQPPACSWTAPMGIQFYDGGVQGCRGAFGGIPEQFNFRTCSSNTCCQYAEVWISGAGVFSSCGTTWTACQSKCATSSGLCGVIPEATTLHFLAVPRIPRIDLSVPIGSSSLVTMDAAAAAGAVATVTSAGPTDAALGSYYINRVDSMSYADAVQYCARSSYMGADWELVRVQDAFDWAASAWTRRDAHEAVSALGFIWVAPSPPLATDSAAQQPSTSSCMRVAFGLPDGLDSQSSTDSHTVAVGDCEAQAAVVCRAVAKPLSASAAAAAAAAAAAQDAAAAAADADTSTTSGLEGVDVGSTYPPASALLGGGSSLGDRGLISPAAAAAVWVPGPHTLTVSNRRLGGGPYVNSTAGRQDLCNVAIGNTDTAPIGSINNSSLASQPSSSSTGAIAGQRATAVVTLQQPVTAISVSVAVQLSNETDSVAVLSGVRLRLGTGGSWQSMGLVSSGGWETFQLAPGEVVVAVSGCMGGFVERLVFHTNTGRRWTHALLGAAAACSVPFLDSAPQQPAAGGGGGYLVGVQGSVGYYIGSLQLVWGSPSQAVSGALGPTAAVLPDGVPVVGTRPQRPSVVLPSQGAGAPPGAGAPVAGPDTANVSDTAAAAGGAGASGSMAPSNVGGSRGIPVAAVAAGAATAGAAAVVAAAALAVVVVRRRRRGQQELGAGKAPPAAQDGSIAGAVGDGSDGSSSCRPACVVATAANDQAATIDKHISLDLTGLLSAVLLSATNYRPGLQCAASVSIVLQPSAAAASPSAAQPPHAPVSTAPSSATAGSGADDAEADPVAAAVLAAALAAPTAAAAMPGRGDTGPVRAPSCCWAPAAANAVGAAVPPAAAAEAGALATAAVPAPGQQQAAWAVMQPGDMESRLGAYVHRLQASIAWNSQPRGQGVIAAHAAGASHAASGADPDGWPPTAATAAAGGSNGLQGSGHAAVINAAAAVEVGDGGTGNAVGQQDIGAAITGMQATLGARQQGDGQGLHIHTVLGRGAFGVVYLGTWRNLRVAIKTLVVHAALAGGKARQRHRAIIEAAISKSLQHPNVVTTYEAEVVPLAVVPEAAMTQDGDACEPEAKPRHTKATTAGEGDVYKMLIIQEYCNVGSLAAALHEGVFGSIAFRGPAMLCGLTLALDIACGMRHIHSRNIIHGDLSAGNVMLSSRAGSDWQSPAAVGGEASGELLAPSAAWSLTGSGDVALNAAAAQEPRDSLAVAESDAQLLRPLVGLWRPPVTAKVSDFGLSLPMGENQTHASNRFQGTPGYAAPEVLSRGRLSLAADVWSFGVLLLELCYGMRFKRIIAQQQAAFGGVAGAGVAGAGMAGAGEDAGTADGGSTTSSAPAWAALPATCPPQLAVLVRACLSLNPLVRPSFDQIATQLLAVLVGSHNACQQVPLQPQSVAAGTPGRHDDS